MVMVGCGPGDEQVKEIIPANATPGDVGDRKLGSPCERSTQCLGTMLCDGSSSQGYCRPARCGERCEAEGGVCASMGGHPAQCWASCEATERFDGLACVEAVEGMVAVPQGTNAAPVSYQELVDLFDAVCESEVGGGSQFGPTRRFSFELSAQDRAFMLVNTVGTHTDFFPVSLTLPDEQVLDLVSDYRHHNARIGDMSEEQRLVGQGIYGEVSVDWSILYPYSPQREEVVQAGTYHFEVAADDPDICLFVHKKSEAGKRIDLNIYFTDERNFNAVEGSADEDLKEVLARVDEIYEVAGIELGKVRYFDVPQPEAEMFRVIRDIGDIAKLTSMGRAPGPTRDDVLSVDLFLVDALSAEGGILLGVSGGIPGAPGMHGNPDNGLVFSVASLGVDNKLVAHIMAHEIGHYVGLRHTTELIVGTSQEMVFDQFVGSKDPLEDTPECANVMRDLRSCPDVDNLMFPAAPASGRTSVAELSGDQAAVLKNSPLIK